MTYFSKRQILLSAQEATYGVAPSMSAATDVINASNIRMSGIEIKAADRGGVRPWYGSTGKIVSGQHIKFGFDIELTQSGTVGEGFPGGAQALIGCGHLLRSAGDGLGGLTMPTSDVTDSLTHQFWKDNKLRTVTGWRGSMKLKMAVGEIPVLSFDGIGLYAAAQNFLPPKDTLDFSMWRDPVAVSSLNTVATFYGYDLLISEFSLDQGGEVVYRDAINGEAVRIVGRKSTGSITFEAPDLATVDDYEVFLLGNGTSQFQLSHGTVSGDISRIQADRCQIISHTEAEKDGVETITLGLEFLPTAGDDEYFIQQM